VRQTNRVCPLDRNLSVEAPECLEILGAQWFKPNRIAYEQICAFADRSILRARLLARVSANSPNCEFARLFRVGPKESSASPARRKPMPISEEGKIPGDALMLSVELSDFRREIFPSCSKCCDQFALAHRFGREERALCKSANASSQRCNRRARDRAAQSRFRESAP